VANKVKIKIKHELIWIDHLEAQLCWRELLDLIDLHLNTFPEVSSPIDDRETGFLPILLRSIRFERHFWAISMTLVEAEIQ
jgi:hypothetical protein